MFKFSIFYGGKVNLVDTLKKSKIVIFNSFQKRRGKQKIDEKRELNARYKFLTTFILIVWCN